MNYFVTVSNAAYLETLRQDSTSSEPNWWTVNRHARPGDVMAIYLTDPISALVGSALLVSQPELIEDPWDAWFGHWRADVAEIILRQRFIPRRELLTLFPAWGYWRQPRLPVRVPPQFTEQLEALLGRKKDSQMQPNQHLVLDAMRAVSRKMELHQPRHGIKLVPAWPVGEHFFVWRDGPALALHHAKTGRHICTAFAELVLDAMIRTSLQSGLDWDFDNSDEFIRQRAQATRFLTPLLALLRNMGSINPETPLGF